MHCLGVEASARHAFGERWEFLEYVSEHVWRRPWNIGSAYDCFKVFLAAIALVQGIALLSRSSFNDTSSVTQVYLLQVERRQIDMIIALRHDNMIFDFPLVDKYIFWPVSDAWSGKRRACWVVLIPQTSSFVMKPFLIRVDSLNKL